MPRVEDSILDDMSELIGNHGQQFETDLKIHINSIFSILNQLGVGPSEGFKITGNSQKWSDYIFDTEKLEMVKTYIYLRLKVIFDPPASGTIMDAYKKEIDELTWRLNVAVDPSPGGV